MAGVHDTDTATAIHDHYIYLHGITLKFSAWTFGATHSSRSTLKGLKCHTTNPQCLVRTIIVHCCMHGIGAACIIKLSCTRVPLADQYTLVVKIHDLCQRVCPGRMLLIF